MRLALFTVFAAIAAAIEVQEWVDVAPDTALRVVTRTSDLGLPVLLYQPFANVWPQLHAGDKHFLPLSDTYSLLTFDPRGIGGSTGDALSRTAVVDADDLARVAEYAHKRFARDVYVLAISTAGPATARAVALHPKLFRAATFVAPVVDMAHTRGALLAEIERVWGISPGVTLRLPALAQQTLVLLRTPYLRCHERLWCSGEFYGPYTYAYSAYYPTPLWTYVQIGHAMLAYANGDATDTMRMDAEARFALPVHFVTGAHDYGITPVSTLETYVRDVSARAAVRPRLTIVPNASHAVHIEQGDAVRAIVRDMVPASERRRVVPLTPPRRAYPTKLPLAVLAVVGVMLLLGVLLGRGVLPPWIARKAIHIGIGGVLLVRADLDDWRVRAIVYAVTVGVVAGALLAYRFAAVQDRLYFLHRGVVDPGVTTYVVICSVCCAWRVEFADVLPLFLADPMGAIVGRTVTSARVYGSKTLAGTAAVWLTAYATLYGASTDEASVVATVLAAVELFGGDFDNPLIGAILLLRAAVLPA